MRPKCMKPKCMSLEVAVLADTLAMPDELSWTVMCCHCWDVMACVERCWMGRGRCITELQVQLESYRCPIAVTQTSSGHAASASNITSWFCLCRLSDLLAEQAAHHASPSSCHSASKGWRCWLGTHLVCV